MASDIIIVFQGCCLSSEVQAAFTAQTLLKGNRVRFEGSRCKSHCFVSDRVKYLNCARGGQSVYHCSIVQSWQYKRHVQTKYTLTIFKRFIAFRHLYRRRAIYSRHVKFVSQTRAKDFKLILHILTLFILLLDLFKLVIYTIYICNEWTLSVT